MRIGGVHGVLMKPEGLDPLRLKSRETAKGLLSFLRTADYLTEIASSAGRRVGGFFIASDLSVTLA